MHDDISVQNFLIPIVQFTVLKILCKIFFLPTVGVIVAHPVVKLTAMH
jgi:hypothetical protein